MAKTQGFKRKIYLGNGAYAKFKNGVLAIYNSDGITITNIIFLEETEIENLQHFLKEIKQDD